MRRSRIKSEANVSFFAFQDIITSVSGILILIVLMMVLMLRTPGGGNSPVDLSERRSLHELENLIESAIERIKDLATKDLLTGGESIDELKDEIARLQKELNTEGDPLRLALLRDVEAVALELARIRSNVNTTEAETQQSLVKLAELQAAYDARADFLQQNKEASQVWLRFNPTEKSPIILELSDSAAVLRDIRNPDFRETIAASAISARVLELAGRNDRSSSYFVFFIRPSGIEHVSLLRELLAKEGFSLGYRALAEDAVVKIYTEETLEFPK